MRVTLRNLAGNPLGDVDLPHAPDALVVRDIFHLRIFRGRTPPPEAPREYVEVPDALHLDRSLRLAPPSLPPPAWRRRPPSYDELQTQPWWWRRDPDSLPRLCFVRPSRVVEAVVHDLSQMPLVPPALVDAAPVSSFSASEWAPAVAP